MGKEKAVFAFFVIASAFFIAFAAQEFEKKKMPVFVFAYGPNLDKATFVSRAGGFESAAPAKLEGFRLEFASQGKAFGTANIVEDGKSSVAGAIYTISYWQAQRLDEAMGVPGFYQRKEVMATLPDGRKAKAEAYVLAGNVHYAPPSRPTVEAAARGLEQFGYGQQEKDALAAAAKGESQ
jgi:gamma-glutamylcyclotransferase (GGCT)/AIG2-like uncharacterized protein YtfP